MKNHVHQLCRQYVYIGLYILPSFIIFKPLSLPFNAMGSLEIFFLGLPRGLLIFLFFLAFSVSSIAY